MIKILDSKLKNFDVILDRLLSQRRNKIQLKSNLVTKIINDVKKNGDKAILKYERKFNKNNIIIPSSKQISKSITGLEKKIKYAIDLAYARIYKFHALQKVKNISYTDKLKNKLEYKYIPIESVAIYVPGSSASYPSSLEGSESSPATLKFNIAFASGPVEKRTLISSLPTTDTIPWISLL